MSEKKSGKNTQESTEDLVTEIDGIFEVGGTSMYNIGQSASSVTFTYPKILTDEDKRECFEKLGLLYCPDMANVLVEMVFFQTKKQYMENVEKLAKYQRKLTKLGRLL